MWFRERKRRNLAIVVVMQPEHIQTQTAALSDFSILFYWRTIFRTIYVHRRSVSSYAILNNLHLKYFPLTDIPDINTSSTSESTVAFIVALN